MIQHLPVFGICGYSGSGKTTLIVELIQRLSAQGMKVGVIKHDVHGLNVDHEGKDSDCFFKVGADVLMRGPDQIFLRARPREEIDLEALLKRFCHYYDLVLLEGHKSIPLVDKVWLLKDDQETCPPEIANVRRVLRRDEDRAGIVMEMLMPWLTEKLFSTPVYAGILIGGESLRMGRPKHLLSIPLKNLGLTPREVTRPTGNGPFCRPGDPTGQVFQRDLLSTADGRTWIELIVESVQSLVERVVILGKGEIPKSLKRLPVLPDIEDARASPEAPARRAQGPLAGILSAMRWRPDVSWLFLSCDMPQITTDAVRWLLSNRKPGVWAILPRRTESEGVEPLPGWYDFRSQHLLETCRGPGGLAGHAKVTTPLIPGKVASAWMNVNTVSDLAAVMPSQDNITRE